MTVPVTRGSGTARTSVMRRLSAMNPPMCQALGGWVGATIGMASPKMASGAISGSAGIDVRCVSSVATAAPSQHTSVTNTSARVWLASGNASPSMLEKPWPMPTRSPLTVSGPGTTPPERLPTRIVYDTNSAATPAEPTSDHRVAMPRRAAKAAMTVAMAMAASVGTPKVRAVANTGRKAAAATQQASPTRAISSQRSRRVTRLRASGASASAGRSLSISARRPVSISGPAGSRRARIRRCAGR